MTAEPEVWINRRSGVAHADRGCSALAGVPGGALRREPRSASDRRRHCPRCWSFSPSPSSSLPCPRTRALAADGASVTARSAGNPEGVDGGSVGRDLSGARAGNE